MFRGCDGAGATLGGEVDGLLALSAVVSANYRETWRRIIHVQDSWERRIKTKDNESLTTRRV